jgi:hypothetical protein
MKKSFNWMLVVFSGSLAIGALGCASAVDGADPGAGWDDARAAGELGEPVEAEPSDAEPSDAEPSDAELTDEDLGTLEQELRFGATLGGTTPMITVCTPTQVCYPKCTPPTDPDGLYECTWVCDTICIR